MRAEWQWIFSLNLESKQRNRWHKGAQNKTFSQSKNQRERKIASTWHVCSSCFLFPFYFTPENINWGNVCVESSKVCCFVFDWYRENVALKIYEINVSRASFRRNYTVNGYENASLHMFCCFWVRFRQKNGFCVLVNVHEMAKIRKVLCKQYVSTEKTLKSPNILWLFCEL